MQSVEQGDRVSVVRRAVMNAIMVNGLGRALQGVAPDGSKPVLVVSEHETLAVVVPRVLAVGGVANVFALMDNNVLVGGTVRAPVEDAVHHEIVGHDTLDLEVELGMVIAAARQNGAVLTFAIDLDLDALGVTSHGALVTASK